MVRLKEFISNEETPVETRFQFQYGSIKREQPKWVQHFIILFQFQYGSIKRKAPHFFDGEFSLFQFQYGSIKRIAKVNDVPVEFRSFNSNMVRLKGGSGSTLIACEQSFNSNMVRLKAVCQARNRNRRNVFQFQYGSIKRNPDFTAHLSHVGFNSNMVRLKVCVVETTRHMLFSFNSNMVRLKESENAVRQSGKT